MSAIVANVEGEVTYTDDSNDSFSSSLDDAGIIATNGSATAFGDALTRLQTLFTALGGSLSVPGRSLSGKTVRDVWVRFELGATIDTAKLGCFSEYTAKSGVFVENAVDYLTAIATFKTTLQSMIQSIAGATVTLT